MNRLFTVLLCVLSLGTFAQNDSVSLGSGATNMVFYNLRSGAKTTAANNDWHIAFASRYIAGITYATTCQAAAIRINEAYGLKLFRCPNQKFPQWASFDTTGWQGWQQMHNPDTSWKVGAFNINRNVNDQFNYGWGEYNIGDHNIYSDSSIYLIQLPNGSFKKFALINLAIDDTFNFQFGNLDNSGLSVMQILKNNNKNFQYVNLINSSILDKEPTLGNWDFVAMRYNNTAYNSANLTQDIGILTNDADNSFAASGSTAQQPCYSGSYSNVINVIGKSWMGTPGDTVIPGLAYFISGQGGTYKLTLTGFGGAATGEFDFTVGVCSQTGISEIIPSLDMMVYPVPASELINVKLHASAEGNTEIQLLDMSGRVIISQSDFTHVGENLFPFKTASLETGNYIITMASAGSRVNKLISIVK